MSMSRYRFEPDRGYYSKGRGKVKLKPTIYLDPGILLEIEEILKIGEFDKRWVSSKADLFERAIQFYLKEKKKESG